MSRSFISDLDLIDRLNVNDTEAFEELYRRYWYSLYTYCIKKLQSSEDSRKIVRDIFIDLWEKRKQWPVSFSVSHHLYTEVRKSVVTCLNEKLMSNNYSETLQEHITTGFTAKALRSAGDPVQKKYEPAQSGNPNTTPQSIKQDKEPKHYNLGNMKWFLQVVSAKLF